MRCVVKVVTNTDHIRFINGIPLEALITQLLRNPHLLGVIALSEAEGAVAAGLAPEVTVEASSSKPATCMPHLILWEPGKAQPAVRWLLMEFADQGRLIDAIEKGWFRNSVPNVDWEMDLPSITQTALEVALGIAALHSLNIVHGELSGANVFLLSSPGSRHGFKAKVANYGCDSLTDISSRCASDCYGSISQLAPEVLRLGQASQEADVYAFGVLFWELVSGVRAWAGLAFDLVVSLVSSNAAQLRFPATTPPEWAALGQACLSYKPEDRPSFSQIVAILDGLNKRVGCPPRVQPAFWRGQASLQLGVSDDPKRTTG
eukprot:jgi/Botrbrau1/18256/Bobra.0894s0002.1